MDYLLGRISETTHEIRAIHDYTRLTEGAVSFLHSVRTGQMILPKGTAEKAVRSISDRQYSTETIRNLIQFPEFWDLLEKIRFYEGSYLCAHKNDYRDTFAEANKVKVPNGWSLVAIEKIADVAKASVNESFAELMLTYKSTLKKVATAIIKKGAETDAM